MDVWDGFSHASDFVYDATFGPLKHKTCWVQELDGKPIRIFRSAKLAFSDLAVDPILWNCTEAISAIRKQVWERSKGFCEKCGGVVTEQDGNLHEVKHRGQGGEISLANSVFLCQPCHRAAHSDRNPKFTRSEK